MKLSNVTGVMEKILLKEKEGISEPNCTEQDLRDKDSQLVSITNLCNQLRSVFQNKKAQKLFTQQGSSVPSIQTRIVDDAN